MVAPEHGRDDYAGLDVRGKIVVVLQGAPKSLQSEERAYYMSRRLKMAAAAQRGAIGLITVQTPAYEKIAPFARSAQRWQAWSMTWRDPAGTAFFPGGAAVPAGRGQHEGRGQAAGRRARDGRRRSWPPPRRPRATRRASRWPSEATVHFRTQSRTLQSANVAGMIEGSDPKLKGEVVVLSAHLDHLGISTPVSGDAIYNGALDNAAGIAAMLEVARGFAETRQAARAAPSCSSPSPPRRRG